MMVSKALLVISSNAVTGTTGDDTLNGTYLDESINALAGNDIVDGGDGDDTLEGGVGNDELVGGSGIDTASYTDANGSVTVDLAAGTATGADGDDTLATIENVTGSAYDDTLLGTDAANVLIGGSGVDHLDGGLGNDTYGIDDPLDVIIEAADGGTDTVLAAITYVLADGLENLTLTGDAAIDGTGNAANNVLTGNAGINTLTGGLGNDTYVLQAGDTAVELAGEGDDTLSVDFDATLGETFENLILRGPATTGTGNAASNVITGNDLANVIDGAAGADRMIGGKGDDTYYLDNIGDRVGEKVGGGVDTVNAAFSWTASANVENVVLVGTARAATGNALDNTLTGNDLANTLNGKGGANTLIGGNGDDTYYADIYDTVIEAAGAGTDTLVFTVSSDLRGMAANVENARVVGDVYLGITGNALANRITAGGANDRLDGGAGADTLIGGKGDDTYFVDTAADKVIEKVDQGNDRVFSTAKSYTLSANVESLVLQGAAVTGIGNALANTITGTSGINVLNGGAGADRMEGGDGSDTYYVDNTGDVVIESLLNTGTDTVVSSIDFAIINGTQMVNGIEKIVLAGNAIRATGSGYSETIVGNDRDNFIDGIAGKDILKGGKGNDTYRIRESSSDSQATVVERAGEGIDTIIVDKNYALDANVENLVANPDRDYAFSGLTLTGNGLANHITASDSDDVLDGGKGADVMDGGGGNDVFYVDNAGDVVSGTGTIRASVSYTLTGVFDLQLVGTSAINGTGDEGANTITGNGAANVLKGLGGNDILTGGGGADTLAGGAGNDRYHIDSADTLVENTGEGIDIAYSDTGGTLGANVEVGAIIGSAAANFTGSSTDNLLGGNAAANVLDGLGGNDSLFGYDGADTLRGGDGADLLWGAGGKDTLTGGAGADTFILSVESSEAGDTITDFVHGTDRLVVVNFYTSGQLLDAGFVNGTQARDSNDIAVYDKSTGRLWADLDGNGPGEKILVAQLTAGTTLSASDIQLIHQNDFAAQIADSEALLLI